MEISAASNQLRDYGEECQAKQSGIRDAYALDVYRGFCKRFYCRLPRELRDVVYSFVNETEEEWTYPVTKHDLECFGLDMAQELSECYYRNKFFFLRRPIPEMEMRLFTEDVLGIIPAHFAHRVSVRLQAYCFIQSVEKGRTSDENNWNFRVVKKMAALKEGAHADFHIMVISCSMALYLSRGIQELFSELEELSKAGLRISIETRIISRGSTVARLEYGSNTFQYEEFVSEIEKVCLLSVHAWTCYEIDWS